MRIDDFKSVDILTMYVLMYICIVDFIRAVQDI